MLFFFQAEDGIRDGRVTGVQTCALPISVAAAGLASDEVSVRAPPRLTPLEARAIRLALEFVGPMIAADARTPLERVRAKIGRASCRESAWVSVSGRWSHDSTTVRDDRAG